MVERGVLIADRPLSSLRPVTEDRIQNVVTVRDHREWNSRQRNTTTRATTNVQTVRREENGISIVTCRSGDPNIDNGTR